MTKHDMLAPAGVPVRFGLPFHGLWKAGSVTLPNGKAHAMSSPGSGSVSLVRVPGMPVVDPSADDLRHGRRWLNYLLVNDDAPWWRSLLPDYAMGGAPRWVYTRGGKGRLIVIDCARSLADGLVMTHIKPFGRASVARTIAISGTIPYSASFCAAKSDGAEAVYLHQYRAYRLVVSGDVDLDAPDFGLTASVVCVDDSPLQHGETVQWETGAPTGATPDPSIVNTTYRSTDLVARYTLWAAYDQTDALVLCQQEQHETTERTSHVWKVPPYGYADARQAVRTVMRHDATITYGNEVLYEYHGSIDSGWKDWQDEPSSPPSGVIPPSDAQLVPVIVENNEYIEPTQGVEAWWDDKSVYLKHWTNSVLGVRFEYAAASQCVDAVAPSGARLSFTIDTSTPCYVTWHPVTNDLVRDTELIAWV